MNSIEKFSYQIFCINFCSTSRQRKCFLALHSTVLAATLIFVNCNSDHTFNVLFKTKNTASTAVRFWFYAYIFIYVVILVEGFWKDVNFQRKYSKAIKEVCERSRNEMNAYSGVVYGLLIADIAYVVISYLTESHYQYLHNSCFFPKLCIRVRLGEYLFFAHPVLKELERIIRRVEELLEDTGGEELLAIQFDYLDLVMMSRDIGDNFVYGLCCILLYIFFDMVVFCYWFITIDFAYKQYYFCKFGGSGMIAGELVRIKEIHLLVFNF